MTRSAKVDDEVDRFLRNGWRIESETRRTVVLVKGKPTNHILHLLLSVFTLGIWIPVWFLMSTNRFAGVRRHVIKLD